MAYKQNAGGPRQAKTGGNLPGQLHNGGPLQKSKPEGFAGELASVRKKDAEGGFMNTLSNIGTGLSHGWSSQGYDSAPSGSGLTRDAGGNKDLGKSIGAAISTAYNYATGDIPKKVTQKNKPKKVRASQTTYLD